MFHSSPTQRRVDSLNVIWLELTLKCNLECVHCYSSSNMLAHDNLTTEDWIDVLSQAAELGCRVVQFVGGEPTLFKGLLPLVEKSRELGYRYVVLFTNATLLSESDLDDLSAYNVELVTSFYSNVRETHDDITQRKGSFDQTVRGIKMILNRGVPLEVSMVRMSQNDNQIAEAIEFLVALGVRRDRIAVGPLRGVGRGALIKKEQTVYSSLCGLCHRDYMVVSSNGAVYPCLLARWLTVGNVKRERLQQILAKPQLIEFRKNVYDSFRNSQNQMIQRTA